MRKRKTQNDNFWACHSRRVNSIKKSAYHHTHTTTSPIHPHPQHTSSLQRFSWPLDFKAKKKNTLLDRPESVNGHIILVWTNFSEIFLFATTTTTPHPTNPYGTVQLGGDLHLNYFEFFPSTSQVLCKNSQFSQNSPDVIPNRSEYSEWSRWSQGSVWFW